MYDGFFKRLNITHPVLQKLIKERVNSLIGTLIYRENGTIKQISDEISALWQVEKEIKSKWWYKTNLQHLEKLIPNKMEY